MAKRWKLNAGGETMIIVRRADLFPPEAATCEPSRLSANLDRWLTDPVSRAVVMEMDEAVHGRPSKILQQTSQDELKRSVKLRLEQAFKQRSLVGVFVPRSFLTQIYTTDGDAGPAKAPPPPQQTTNKPTAWIEIELIDDTGKPVAEERYRIEKPDGTFEEGRLDKQGRARIDNLDPGTCQVTFPEIDAKEWTAA